MPSSETSEEFSKSLELRASEHRFAIPVAYIDRLVDLEISPPPPLAQDWVSGIAIHDNRSLVAIRVYGAVPERTPTRRAHVALLRTTDPDIQWGVEFSVSGRMFDAAVRRSDLQEAGAEQLRSWVGLARDEHRTMWWLDVPVMLHELVGVQSQKGDLSILDSRGMTGRALEQLKHDPAID